MTKKPYRRFCQGAWETNRMLADLIDQRNFEKMREQNWYCDCWLNELVDFSHHVLKVQRRTSGELIVKMFHDLDYHGLVDEGRTPNDLLRYWKKYINKKSINLAGFGPKF